VNKEGVVIGVGRNRRVQANSATRHGETDCLENIGRLPAKMYQGCTMYTTLVRSASAFIYCQGPSCGNLI